MWVLIQGGQVVDGPVTEEPAVKVVPVTRPTEAGEPEPQPPATWVPLVDQRPPHDPAWQTVRPTGAYTMMGDEAVHVGYEVQSKSPAEFRAERLAFLAALRWAKESAGVTVDGMRIRTDRDSQALIDSMHRSLADGIIDAVSFKAESGIYTVDLAAAEAIRTAVVRHVQACRECEAGHAAAIEALPDDCVAIAAYDIGADWP